jgi:Na+-translocating ferredoxin:NAD+ oxidoreductase RnfG subunit
MISCRVFVVRAILLIGFVSYTVGNNVYGQNKVGINTKVVNAEVKKNFGAENFKLEELTVASADEEVSNGVFASVMINDQVVGFAYVGRVNSCRTGGCSVNREEPKADGSHEYFDYLVLFDHRVSVKLVKVINYQASHGHEISARGWLKQFIGFNGEDEMQVGKNVDAISGATISVYAITYDVNRVTRMLADMQRNNLLITRSGKMLAGN